MDKKRRMLNITIQLIIYSHFSLVFLQSSFVNRAALGLFPPVSFAQDLKDALLSVSLQLISLSCAQLGFS